jgi:hypothetical protein
MVSGLLDRISRVHEDYEFFLYSKAKQEIFFEIKPKVLIERDENNTSGKW